MKKTIDLIENAKLDFQTALRMPFHILPQQIKENHLSIEVDVITFDSIRSEKKHSYFFYDTLSPKPQLYAQGIKVFPNRELRDGTVRVVLGFLAG